MSYEVKTTNVALSPELAKMLSASKAIIKATENVVPGGKPAPISPAMMAEEREVPISNVDVNQFRPQTPKTVNEEAITRMLQGVPSSKIVELQAKGYSLAKHDPIAAANRLLEGLEDGTPTSRTENVVDKESSKREILKEVILNMRQGGLLREEILKIVLQEALTEKQVVPLLEKHFDALMRNFMAKRKNA